MNDYATYDPSNYSVDDLMRAAHGDTRMIAASLAVQLLQAKIGVNTETTMALLAADTTADPRARRTATLALADFPRSAPLLQRLVEEDADEKIAAAARTALSRLA